MYLLSELQRPDSVSSSLYCRFADIVNPVLVEVKANHVDIYHVSLHGANELLYTAYFQNKIRAILSISIGSDHALVALDSSNTVSLIYREGKDKLTVHELDRLDTEGHQLTIDTEPILVANSEVFVLHHVQGYLQLFTINKNISTLAELQRTNKKRKFAADKLWSSRSVSIGAIVVLKMSFQDSTIAVLYRDFDFNYSLRYYQLVDGEIRLVKQFEDFDCPPTCLIPISQGGVLVITTTHIFYFSKNNVEVSLDSTLYDNTLVKSGNSVTKAISTELLHETFLSFTVIDDSRTLVVSNLGNTYRIYLVLEQLSGHFIKVKNFNFIKLGKSSIPISNGLHHISDNYFYIVSKWSQSVTFQVLSSQPFIKIISFQNNTTPIIDLQYSIYNAGLTELVTCQGGYESGEFVKTHYGKFSIEWKSHLKLANGLATRVGSIKNSKYAYTTSDGSIDIFKYDGRLSTTNDLSLEESAELFDVAAVVESGSQRLPAQDVINSPLLSLSEFGVSFNQEFTPADIVLDGRIVDNYVFCINEADKIHVFDRGTLVASYETRKKFASFEVTKVSNVYLIFVTWLDKSFTVIRFHNAKLEEILDEELPGSSSVFNSVLVTNTSRINFIYSNLDGSLIQIKLKYNNRSLHKEGNVFHCTSKIPMKLNTNGALIIGQTQDELYVIIEDQLFEYYRLCYLTSEIKGITDIAILADGAIMVLAQNELSVLQINVKTSQLDGERLYSPVIYTKSLRLKKLTIVITQENKLNDNGTAVKYSNLELINNSKMSTVHTFSVGKPVEFVDIILFPKSDNSLQIKGEAVLAIVRDGEANWLYLLSVKKEKILLVHSFAIGIECILQSVKCFDTQELVFSLCGNIIMLVQYSISNAGEIIVTKNVSTNVKIPILSVSHTSVENDCFIADVTGLIECEIQDRNDKLFVAKRKSSFGQQFLTCMDAGSIRGETTVITGDAHGNLVIKSNNSSTKFNIGWDQVNCIALIRNEIFADSSRSKDIAHIGTLNGGLYKISQLFDERIVGILEECSEELSSYSLQYNADTLAYKQRKMGSGEFLRVPPEGIIDMRLIRKFVVAKMHKREKSKTYISCNTNLQLLESLCFEGTNL